MDKPRSERVQRTTTPAKTPAQWWTKTEAQVHVRMRQAYDRMLKRLLDDAERQVFAPARKAADKAVREAKRRRKD